MKTITKAIMYLQMTALCLTAALAGPRAANKGVPFRGSLEAVETHEVDFPMLLATGSGTGNATHLGRFTMDFVAHVDLLSQIGIGTAHFITANGDSLFTDVIGQGNPTGDPDVVRVVELYTITGGTGRFADATGSFTIERVADLVTGFSDGSFDGTIVFGKAK